MVNKTTQPLTMAQWLTEAQVKAGVADTKLAFAMGYESTQVVALLKSGQMRVPLNKTVQLANALGVKPGVLLRRLLRDIDPDLLNTIELCVGPLQLSTGEQKLILAVRRAGPNKEPVSVMLAPQAVTEMVIA